MSRLDDYIEKLNCLDEAERIYAAEDIGHLNTRDGVVALLERLGKKTSRAVRDVIFQALIRIDADEAIEGSIRLFGSEDPQIRNQEPRSRACSSSWRTNANCISDCWTTNLGCGPAWFRARGIVPTVRGGVRRSPGANRDRRACFGKLSKTVDGRPGEMQGVSRRGHHGRRAGGIGPEMHWSAMV